MEIDAVCNIYTISVNIFFNKPQFPSIQVPGSLGKHTSFVSNSNTLDTGHKPTAFSITEVPLNLPAYYGS
jgi:hypothetical protein